MKKILIMFMILGMFVMNVPQAQAVTLNDLQKEVEILKQEIISLKSVMSGQVLGALVPKSITYSLGMKSSEIVKFQQALIDQKYLSIGNATGLFGPLTLQAVKSFQTAKGLKADGVLGAETQASLLAITGWPEPLCAPDSWVKRTNVGGMERSNAVGFSIGKFGYIGMGSKPLGGTYKDLWSWDQATGIWTQKADLPKNGFTLGVSFSIGNYGYIGVGTSSNVHPKDFWQYDSLLNEWVQKADFKGESVSNATGFSDGQKGYIGLGYNNGQQLKELWQYNPKLDVWTEKKDYPGKSKSDPVGFFVKGKAYIVAGYGLGSEEVWEYNSLTDSWIQKKDFPKLGNRGNAVGFAIGSHGYMGTGGNLKDFWQYDSVADKWTQKADFKGGNRWSAVGFSIGDKGYIGTGSISGGYTKDFWQYCPGVIN